MCDGGAGFAAQARGLARAIAVHSGGEVAEKNLTPPPLFSLLPGFLFSRRWMDFSAVCGAPDIAVICGSRAAALGIALRARGAFSVFVQNPPFAVDYFDAVVAPMHDRLRGKDRLGGGNVIETLGAVGEVTAENSAARKESAMRKFARIPTPRIGVLIGGENRAFSFSDEDAKRFALELKSAAQKIGGGILATASRRTGDSQKKILAENLSGDGNFFWSPADGGENPYMDILAAADFLIATGDSVNMASEACAAAKPVFIWIPPCRPLMKRSAAKFFAFHESLFARKLARPWRGELTKWESPPLAETARAAEEIWRRFQLKKA